MPNPLDEKSRDKARKFLGDLSNVDIADLCNMYEAAELAGEVWTAALNKPRTGGDDSWAGRLIDKKYSQCFYIRQVIAAELATRPNVPDHSAYRRIRALADWSEACGGEEEVEGFKAAVASICPDCYSVGHGAERSCCGGRVAA